MSAVNQITTMSARNKRTWFPDAGMPWCANPFVEWLLTEALIITSIPELLGGLCRRLVAEDIPLWRMYCLIRTLHPQVFGTSYTWRRDTDAIEEVSAPHGTLESTLHLESPCAAIFDGASAIRRRLDIARPRLDFPILEDLHAENATDYVAMPLPFSDGQVSVISFAADRPGGFSEQELERIHDTLPVLGLRIEVQAMRRTAGTLLNTYLGRHSGERVLNGLIKRGDGEDIHAVIWFCDLRDSTALADSMPREAFLGLLNAFFDCVAGAVLEHGGEVLRFMGDAVLAIFPTGQVSTTAHRECRGIESACRAALAAATVAQANLKALNAARARTEDPPLGFGLALHMGDVMYGNVGVPERLEFTVIGAAANEAARLEDMCKTLDRPILVSAEFARCFPGELVSLGKHNLRGISVPQEIHTLPDGLTAGDLT